MSRSSALLLNLQSVKQRMFAAASASQSSSSPSCRLVVVSKTKPAEDIRILYEQAKHVHFGENYIQELVAKAKELPREIRWHFIGHLQTNKVKLLLANVPHLAMVESVSSLKLAKKLNDEVGLPHIQAERQHLQQVKKGSLQVMVQVNTSCEEQKNGVSPQACVAFVQELVATCPNLHFVGLMTIGKLDAPSEKYFESLHQCRREVALALQCQENELELSMGMSGDFELAIAKGSTNIRVGSTIMGTREYTKDT